MKYFSNTTRGAELDSGALRHDRSIACALTHLDVISFSHGQEGTD